MHIELHLGLHWSEACKQHFLLLHTPQDHCHCLTLSIAPEAPAKPSIMCVTSLRAQAPPTMQHQVSLPELHIWDLRFVCFCAT